MLRRIVAKYGNDLCSDVQRCRGLLKDLCGEYRREINVLINAVEERIPLDLLAAKNSMPPELLLTKLAKRLEDNLGLTGEASQWAVDSWALALGIVTEAEIEANEKSRKTAKETVKETERNTVLKNDSQKPVNTPPILKPQVPTKPLPKTHSPKTPPVIYPPIARTPVNVPKTSPPPAAQKSGASVNVPQNSPQQNAATIAVPKKRFRKFFGCLFIIFLLFTTGVVLLFGVPYAIKVMRETQQQNEPSRFPR